MHIDVKSIVARLLECRTSVDKLCVSPEAGVYAYHLIDSDALTPFSPAESGLVYVGLSSELRRREFEDHLQSKRTGKSTLRRTLGAILKESLKLTAIPRGLGRSAGDFTHYRFTDDGEHRLTEWMRHNLEIGLCTVADPDPVEAQLIPILKPILNLNRWRNPRAAELRKLRKICADEARSNRELRPNTRLQPTAGEQ